VLQLKTEREEKGEDELDKPFRVVQERKVGRLIVEIDGDGAIFAGRFRGLSHVSPSVQMAVGTGETSRG
jgi:hypothetical protein